MAPVRALSTFLLLSSLLWSPVSKGDPTDAEITDRAVSFASSFAGIPVLYESTVSSDEVQNFPGRIFGTLGIERVGPVRSLLTNKGVRKIILLPPADHDTWFVKHWYAGAPGWLRKRVGRSIHAYPTNFEGTLYVPATFSYQQLLSHLRTLEPYRPDALQYLKQEVMNEYKDRKENSLVRIECAGWNLSYEECLASVNYLLFLKGIILDIEAQYDSGPFEIVVHSPEAVIDPQKDTTRIYLTPKEIRNPNSVSLTTQMAFGKRLETVRFQESAKACPMPSTVLEVQMTKFNPKLFLVGFLGTLAVSADKSPTQEMLQKKYGVPVTIQEGKTRRIVETDPIRIYGNDRVVRQVKYIQPTQVEFRRPGTWKSLTQPVRPVLQVDGTLVIPPGKLDSASSIIDTLSNIDIYVPDVVEQFRQSLKDTLQTDVEFDDAILYKDLLNQFGAQRFFGADINPKTVSDLAALLETKGIRKLKLLPSHKGPGFFASIFPIWNMIVPRHSETIYGKWYASHLGMEPPTVEGVMNVSILVTDDELQSFLEDQVGADALGPLQKFIQDNLELARAELQRIQARLYEEVRCEKISYATCIQAIQKLRDRAHRVTSLLLEIDSKNDEPLRNLTIILTSSRESHREDRAQGHIYLPIDKLRTMDMELRHWLKQELKRGKNEPNTSCSQSLEKMEKRRT